MTRLLYAVASFSALVSTLGSAGLAGAQEVTGNVAITSDYTFRGVSQTLEKPAIQGGLDLEGPKGAYLGAWGSSVNFGEDLSGGARAQVELDFYGGFAPSFAGLDLDLGIIYYAYPGAASGRAYDFLEGVIGASREIGPISTGVTGAYSPDFFGGSGSAVFAGLEASTTLTQAPLSLAGSYGLQKIEKNDVFGTPDYAVWTAGVSAELLGSTVGAMVTGTDMSTEDCFGGSDLCRTRLIVSIARGM